MNVAAIIVSYRSAEHVLRCVRAILASARPFDRIVICENGGTGAFDTLTATLADLDGTDAPAGHAATPPVGVTDGPDASATRVVREAILRHHAVPITILEASDNLGYAGGVNLCLERLRGEAWDAAFILNPDAEVAPAALDAVIAHAANSAYGAIGCRLLFDGSGRVQMYGGRWRSWIARTLNLGFNQPAEARPDSAKVERDLDFVCGAAMFVTRHFVETVGPMDETYFLYMEEVDWCFRRGSLKLGYAHDAVVRHVHGATTGASAAAQERSPLSIYLNERNKLVFTRRFFPLRYPVVIVTTFLFNLLYLHRAGFSSFRHALDGWMAGLRGETGRPARFSEPARS